jgi:hydrogenase nickel incorporation protein HypA/HybF
MHEYSIATGITQTILENAQKHNAAKVLTINLEIGDLVSLNAEQILFWLKELFKQTIAQDAEIKINHISPKIRCLDCHYEGSIKFEDDPRYHFSLPTFLCPKCNSVNIQVVQGKECFIKNIEVMT